MKLIALIDGNCGINYGINDDFDQMLLRKPRPELIRALQT